MNKMIIKCPSCGETYDAGPEYSGKTFKCYCGNVVSVPDFLNAGAAKPAPTTNPASAATNPATTNPATNAKKTATNPAPAATTSTTNSAATKAVTTKAATVTTTNPQSAVQRTAAKPVSRAVVTATNVPAATNVAHTVAGSKGKSDRTTAYGVVAALFGAIAVLSAIVVACSFLWGIFVLASIFTNDSVALAPALVLSAFTIFFVAVGVFVTFAVSAAICRIADVAVRHSNDNEIF